MRRTHFVSSQACNDLAWARQREPSLHLPVNSPWRARGSVLTLKPPDEGNKLPQRSTNIPRPVPTQLSTNWGIKPVLSTPLSSLSAKTPPPFLTTDFPLFPHTSFPRRPPASVEPPYPVFSPCVPFTPEALHGVRSQFELGKQVLLLLRTLALDHKPAKARSALHRRAARHNI